MHSESDDEPADASIKSESSEESMEVDEDDSLMHKTFGATNKYGLRQLA